MNGLKNETEVSMTTEFFFMVPSIYYQIWSQAKFDWFWATFSFLVNLETTNDSTRPLQPLVFTTNIFS